MIIVMSNVATEEQIESVIKRIEEKGLEANVSRINLLIVRPYFELIQLNYFQMNKFDCRKANLKSLDYL